jgi:hypothetical protein
MEIGWKEHSPFFGISFPQIARPFQGKALAAHAAMRVRIAGHGLKKRWRLAGQWRGRAFARPAGKTECAPGTEAIRRQALFKRPARVRN